MLTLRTDNRAYNKPYIRGFAQNPLKGSLLRTVKNLLETFAVYRPNIVERITENVKRNGYQ